MGPVDDIFYRPTHPYTLGLIRAVPTVTGDFEDLISIPGAPPDLVDPAAGLQISHPRAPTPPSAVKRKSRSSEPTTGQITPWPVSTGRRDADAIWQRLIAGELEQEHLSDLRKIA